MHRVVLWVEQGRQVVDSQLVCTTPAAGLRVMLANHSRSGGCTFAIRNRYLSVPLARCVHHSRRKICTFYKLWQRPIHNPALWVAADGAVLFHLQFLPAAT